MNIVQTEQEFSRLLLEMRDYPFLPSVLSRPPRNSLVYPLAQYTEILSFRRQPILYGYIHLFFLLKKKIIIEHLLCARSYAGLHMVHYK